MGDVIVILILCGAVFLSARSLFKTKKKGGCTGSCATCSGCGCGCGKKNG